MDKSTILTGPSHTAKPASASRRSRDHTSALAHSLYPLPASPARVEHSRTHAHSQHRRREPSVTYPDSLKPGPDRNDDFASATGAQARMNQSMFSLIAAAGTKRDFQTKFGDESSGSDTEKEDEARHTGKLGRAAERGTVKDKVSQDAAHMKQIRQDRILMGQGTAPGLEPLNFAAEDEKVGNYKRTENKLQRAIPKLQLHNQRERNYMSQSMILPGKMSNEPGSITPRDAPVMRRIVEDQAQAEQPTDSRSKKPRSSKELQRPSENTQDSSPKLAHRLKEIFGFEEPEEVISEYPCWLLQSILLQGYLYITSKHFCFYAYLPKKSNLAIKTGSLMKRLKRAPKYTRQWFILKGDILTYYDNPSSLYFQAGHIDLRYGISASVVDSKDKSKEARDFTVVTQNRTYYFRADSAVSANEWVKALQRVIFRTHNDGDSVKIALPVENVIDIEESPVIEFARTVKIRVIDNDETFAIDEYFFSFFSFGEDAMAIMQSMVPPLQPETDLGGLVSPIQAAIDSPKRQARHRRNTSASSGMHEPVKNTLSPTLPPIVVRNRAGSDVSSAGRSRAGSASPAIKPRRGSTLNSGTHPSPSIKPSEPNSESFVESGMASSGLNLSGDDFQSSASQVLSRSDIFRRPKVDRFPQSPDVSDGEDEIGKRTDNGSIQTQKRELTSRAATPKVPNQNAQHSSVSTTTELEGSTPSLRKLVKAGQYPLQRAAGIASYIHRGSKDMSALLATKSMDYVEKVSGMWAGGKQYYQPDLKAPDNADDDREDEGGHVEAGNRFRAHFGLPDSERLLATYFGYLHRVLPLYGKIYIGDTTFCFRSLLPGTKTKIILPMVDIETVDKETGFSLGYHGLVIVIQGFEEMFFEFHSREIRDDCAVFLLRRLDGVKYHADDDDSEAEEDAARAAKVEHKALMDARRDGYDAHELKLTDVERNVEAEGGPNIIFDDPRASFLNFKPAESLRITCLTIGSRGDVQPYISLCKGLLAEGHKPKIATHSEFEDWVRSHGIDFAPVGGDPAELMRICVENGMFTPAFFKEATSKFRGWLDDLLASAWGACRDSDLLIESPSAMAGIHIAEALKIPYFRAFTMPWTRTRAYPHAFAVPEHRMGGAYNKMTYVLFDNVFWTAIAGQVNRWRKNLLQLPSTNLDKLHPNKVPFLYNYSPSVVAPPLDYSDWIRVTGYWFLDEGNDYQPDRELATFIKQARVDGKKLVYIGFGSIVVSDPAAMTRSVVESVQKADVRCILSKGWSDRLGKNSDNTKTEVPLPSEIHQIKACPHDWLFKQVDCAVHHGGAGTTGASLRAGLPTIIKPFFGDQFFFGTRVEDLGVGICLKKLNVSLLSRALWEATHSERMIVKARILGDQIRSEDGVATAIQAIYRDMEYAKSLIKNRNTAADPDAADAPDEEESWTFIEDESDPELTRRMVQWDGVRHRGDSEQDAMETNDGHGGASRHRRIRSLSINKVGGLIKKESRAVSKDNRPRFDSKEVLAKERKYAA